MGVGAFIQNSAYAEIVDSSFDNHNSFKSGALHLDNLDDFLIKNCTF